MSQWNNYQMAGNNKSQIAINHLLKKRVIIPVGSKCYISNLFL